MNKCHCYYLYRYRSFLEQFSAVSYGDHLFGYFVLIPLQQRCPVCLRRMLWEDYPHLLRMLSQPLEQVHYSGTSLIIVSS